MPTTTTLPLPTDRQLLRAYLPTEPSESAVAASRAGARRLDEIITGLVARLDEQNRKTQAAIAALATAAAAGNRIDIDQLKQDMAERQSLENIVAGLRQSHSIIVSREAALMRTDPIYTAWVQDCRRITQEWELAMTADSDDQRFGQLVAFAERHRPNGVSRSDRILAGR